MQFGTNNPDSSIFIFGITHKIATRKDKKYCKIYYPYSIEEIAKDIREFDIDHFFDKVDKYISENKQIDTISDISSIESIEEYDQNFNRRAINENESPDISDISSIESIEQYDSKILTEET